MSEETARAGLRSAMQWAGAAMAEDVGAPTPDSTPAIEALTTAIQGLSDRVAVLEERISEPAPPPTPPPIVIGPTTPPPPPPVTQPFADGNERIGVRGRVGFDPLNPTLKDGRPLEGDALRAYNALRAWAMRTDLSGDWAHVDLVNRMRHPDLYNVAREASGALSAIRRGFSLTGDLALLEVVGRAARAFRETTVIRWEGYSTASDKWKNLYTGPQDPWSPYPKKLYRGGGGAYVFDGTDMHIQNIVIMFSVLAEMAWMLWRNRDLVGPSGRPFGPDATAAVASVVDYAKAWSLDTSGAPWTTNYKGQQWTHESGYMRRAAPGSYPMVFRDGSHTYINNVIVHHYLARLGLDGAIDLPNAAGAQAFANECASRLPANAYYSCATPLGPGITLPRAGWKDRGTNPLAVWATYTAYIADWHIWAAMVGGYDSVVTPERMTRLARSYQDMHNPDGTTKRNINANEDRGGLIGAGDGTGKERTVRQQSLNGYAGMLVFEDGDYLKTIAERVQAGDSGGWTKPNSAILASQLLVRETGVLKAG